MAHGEVGARIEHTHIIFTGGTDQLLFFSFHPIVHSFIRCISVHSARGQNPLPFLDVTKKAPDPIQCSSSGISPSILCNLNSPPPPPPPPPLQHSNTPTPGCPSPSRSAPSRQCHLSNAIMQQESHRFPAPPPCTEEERDPR